ncbi:MAG TPA: hypothetical protein PKG60_14610 [Spirochaetota bacterium]|nr:hypothetical protein [Spirochaetota bacterium]HPS87627.1 hypothetical protein [Spirochaetota bacterium]
MRRFINILMAVIFTAVFSSSPVFSAEAEIEENSDNVITGILVKIDSKNHWVYVKENSRIVKFKALPALCESFKYRINSQVEITYKIGDNKSLQIITMVISEKKEESVKSKVFLKNKSKK